MSVQSRFHKIILIFAFFIIFILPKGYSQYYVQDNFANGNNWKLNQKYSVSKGVWLIPNATTGRANSWSISGGKVTMNAWVQNKEEFTEPFYGIYAIFTNQFFSASKENPFGIEITRWRMRNDNGFLNDPSGGFLAGVFDIGLVQRNPDVLNNVDLSLFNYSTLVTELDWQHKNSVSWWNWRQASLTNTKIPMYSVTNKSGVFQSIQSLMEWNQNNINNNAIRFRFEHDGEYVYFYVNPNPYGLNALYSNTFFLVDKRHVPASFDNDLSLLFGFAHKNDNRTFSGYGWGIQQNIGELTNFVIRSVADSITAEISPGTIKAGGSNSIVGVISADFSTHGVNYAGIGEIYIDLPINYTNWANYTNGIQFFWIDGVVTNASFGIEKGDKNPGNGNVAISLKNSGQTLKVRFSGKTSDGDIFHPNNLGGTTDPAIMFVISNFITHPGADSTGKAFTIYAGNEKYHDTDWSKYATTGKMKASAGDAYDLALFSLVDENTLTLRTVNNPVGIGSIRPREVYEGDSATFYYDFSIANGTNNNASVTRMNVIVPTGFTIDDTSFTSDRISSNQMYLTNITGKSVIVVDYAAANTRLVAGSGIDTISFKTLSTPVLSGTNLAASTWKSVSSSSVSGTGTFTNVTSLIYPSQVVNIRKKPPSGDAYTLVGAYKNIDLSNSISYIIKNNGQTGNYIEKVRLAFDALFTNVTQISSTLPGTISQYSSNGQVFVEINHKAQNAAITNGFLNTLTFMVKQKVRPNTNTVISGNIKAYADNGNGEGYLALLENQNKWSVSYYTPPAVVRGSISSPTEEGGDILGSYIHNYYTDQTATTNATFTVKNWGQYFNNIYEVEIHAPLDIISISGVNTLNGIGRITNFGATNAVVVSYTNSGLLTAGTTTSAGEEDTITLFFQDSITAPKNVSFRIFAKNTTNKALGANYTPDNMTLHYIYPKAKAKGYVTVPGGFIDAATNAFTISYTITNTGRPGNKINMAHIIMPAQFTNSDFVSDTMGAAADDSGTDILIDYTGVGGLPGGASDTITFIVYDNIGAGEYYLNMTSAVSNDRWYTNGIGIPSGKSQTIHITPPPTLFAYNTSPRVFYNANSEVNTNTLVLSVSNRGWGSNELDKVKITVPAPLVGKVIAVSNVSTGLTNTVGGQVSLSNGGSTIRIEYDDAGSRLTPGTADQTYITFISDSSAPNNVQWLVSAANNSTNADGSHNFTNYATMLSGGTNQLLLVDKAYGHVSVPNPPVLSTPTTFNTITYYIKNGDETIGAGIKKIRIALSNNVFSSVNNISSAAGYFSTNYFANGSTWVEVWYNGAGLGPKSSDNISFTAFDTNATQEIWVSMPFEADYGDGGGFRGHTGVSAGQTNAVQFQRPSVSALSYVTPVNVPKAYPSQSYRFYLKNNGIVGSDLLRAKISAPDFITNITGLFSPLTASNIITTNAQGYYNVAILFYTNSIISGNTDSITLLAYDAVNVETNGTWTVKVNNAYEESGEANAIVPAGQSLGLSIITPPVDARIKIQATNYISTSFKNTIYSTALTNHLKFDVYNFSGGGDFITYARIKIPAIGTVLNTNGIKVKSLIKTDATWSISNQYILIQYKATNRIGAGFKDEILISIADNINYTNLTVNWSGDAAFDTTYNTFKAASLYSGGSLAINYVMPDPLASISMDPTQVYLKRKEFKLKYGVVNTGTGDNKIDRVYITLPTELRAGFNSTKVSNTIAIATNYVPGTGVLTLSYTNFGTGQTDNLWLKVSNTTTVSGNISVTAKVRNTVNTNTASGNQVLFMATAPSYYMTPNSVDTTTTANSFQVFVNQDSTGTRPIQRVVLNFPTPFTGINTIQSSFFSGGATNIISTASSVTLYYSPGNYIGQLTNKDVITVNLQDGIAIGNLTNAITGYVDDGMGYVPLNLKSGKSVAVGFTMPTAKANVRLNPQYVYLGTLTNSLTISLSNKGTGTSGITHAQIILPKGLSNAILPTSSWGGVAAYNPSSNMITLDYTGGLLTVNQKDDISFSIVNYYGSSTNVNILVKVANLTNNLVYNLADGPLGKYMVASISYPPVAVEGYFPGDNKLYTIETNASLTYRLLNRSYGKTLTKAVLTFSTNDLYTVFNRIKVTSTIPGTTITSNSNTFTLTYDPNNADALKYTLYDDIRLTFNYNITNLFNLQITGKAQLTNDNLVGGTNNINVDNVLGFKSNLRLTNSTWGIAYGDVYPDIRGVNIKVYYPDTTTTATNINGEYVATSTSAGNPDFILTRLPAGNYDVEFSGTGYRKFIQGVIIPANLITNIGTVTMRNGLLTSDPNVGIQLVINYDDTNTFIQFPTGAIGDEFSVDIARGGFSQRQKDSVEEQSTLIANTPNKNVLYGYSFTIRDINDNVIDGQTIELDAIISLSYDMATIASNSWTEADMAIYYWDDNGSQSQWVRVGGTVDTVNKTVVARVSYVHRFYAVMPKASGGDTGQIQNVSLRPKVFTPGRGGSAYYDSVRISFELDQQYESYRVYIYDLKGNMIRMFEKTGGYTQGEVSWDGNDGDGRAVNSGVYVYRVVVPSVSAQYSGTVIIAK